MNSYAPVWVNTLKKYDIVLIPSVEGFKEAEVAEVRSNGLGVYALDVYDSKGERIANVHYEIGANQTAYRRTQFTDRDYAVAR